MRAIFFQCVLTTALTKPHFHTVLFLWDAVDAIIRLVAIPVAVLIDRAVGPLRSALLGETGINVKLYFEITLDPI